MAMQRTLITLLLFISASSWADSSDQWAFFSAVEHLDAWEQNSGYARVVRDRDKLSITIYKKVTALPEAQMEPDEKIEATLSSKGVVRGIRTKLGTDANPDRVTGHYYWRLSKEIWGERPVVVKTESIIFSGSYYSVGLLRKGRVP